jgi:ribosome-binding protein aMBF1 (putative translation factor)
MPRTASHQGKDRRSAFPSNAQRAKIRAVQPKSAPSAKGFTDPIAIESEPSPDDWIEIIRERYFADGWTTYSLAAASGVSDSQIVRFFRGERDLRLQTAERLCRTLGLSLATLSSQRGDDELRKGDC